LGIVASSEKRQSSSAPKIRKKPTRDQLLAYLGDHRRLEDWHKYQAKKHRRKSKVIEDRLKSLDDIVLTPEEIAENNAESEAYMQRLSLGGGVSEPSLETPDETLMEGITPVVLECEEQVQVGEEQIDGRQIIEKTSELRTRYDFSIEVKKIGLEVEKLVLKDHDGERVMVSASTSEYGPEGYSITWGFLASMSLMVAQYALPLNRIANMLSSPDKKFTSGMLAKYFRYVARRLLPVYLELFENLSTSDIFSGDDTTARVIEVSRYISLLRQQSTEHVTGEPPWEYYADTDACMRYLNDHAHTDDIPLGVLTGAVLPFVAGLRSGAGSKTGFNTTVLSGRSDPANPESTIVFYRSHFGGFGDLVSTLLERRPSHLRDLCIQTDLARVNLIADQQLADSHNVTYAGCASHARRPFAVYEHDDPDNCAYMLHLFKGLSIHEQGLNLCGRNHENVSAVRGVDSQRLWDEILELAQGMMKQWSPKTELGQACLYIVRHFDKLTAYLHNSRLSPDNNFSERALRMEKLIEASALFRTSLEGRFALDIIRTVTQTAIMARVEVAEYLEFVMRSDRDEVQRNAARFTPLSYAKSMHTTS
jgi:hypothetical protein